MADRLAVYNEALLLLGERTIVDLNEPVETKRVLDALWAPSVEYLYEGGFFKWSCRTIEMAAATDVEPLFGYNFSFELPDDYVRLASLSTDGFFILPWRHFAVEGKYIFSNNTPLYMTYVSNDDNHMWNIGAWSQAFASALAAYMAFKASNRLTQNKGERADLFSLHERSFKIAKSLDAMNSPTKSLPPGSWTSARRGSLTYRGQGYRRA